VTPDMRFIEIPLVAGLNHGYQIHQAEAQVEI
jgi:hypothetical protein